MVTLLENGNRIEEAKTLLRIPAEMLLKGKEIKSSEIQGDNIFKWDSIPI